MKQPGKRSARVAVFRATRRPSPATASHRSAHEHFVKRPVLASRHGPLRGVAAWAGAAAACVAAAAGRAAGAAAAGATAAGGHLMNLPFASLHGAAFAATGMASAAASAREKPNFIRWSSNAMMAAGTCTGAAVTGVACALRSGNGCKDGKASKPRSRSGNPDLRISIKSRTSTATSQPTDATNADAARGYPARSVRVDGPGIVCTPQCPVACRFASDVDVGIARHANRLNSAPPAPHVPIQPPPKGGAGAHRSGAGKRERHLPAIPAGSCLAKAGAADAIGFQPSAKALPSISGFSRQRLHFGIEAKRAVIAPCGNGLAAPDRSIILS